MLHLFIQTLPEGNITEIDVNPDSTIISILNFIDNPKKSWQKTSRLHFIYNDITLSHYLSFSFQGIKNNSKIIVTVSNQAPSELNNVRHKTHHFISIADQIRQKFIKFDQAHSSVDHEIRRLSDLSFSHLELSSFYTNFYSMKNFIQSQEKNRSKVDCHNKNEVESPVQYDNLYFNKIKKNVPFKLKLTAIPEKKSISEDPLPPCFNFSYL